LCPEPKPNASLILPISLLLWAMLLDLALSLSRLWGACSSLATARSASLSVASCAASKSFLSSPGAVRRRSHDRR